MTIFALEILSMKTRAFLLGSDSGNHGSKENSIPYIHHVTLILSISTVWRPRMRQSLRPGSSS